MGTTLTAVYVGEREVAIAHVGDSRAYCLRDGELLRLTDDHSLVDELMRQGRLTPEEAVEHPQRSVITRALGTGGRRSRSTRAPSSARAGDVYLLCSDGLTTMVSEEQIAAVLLAHPRLRDAGEALIAAANEAGGRDNITVVLLRLEEVGAPAGGADGGDEPTLTRDRRRVQAPPPRRMRAASRAETAGASAAAPPVARGAGRRAAGARRAPPRRRAERRLSAAARRRARSPCSSCSALIGCRRVPGAAVGVLHRHQQPRAGDALPGRPLRAAGQHQPLQQRLRLGRRAPRRSRPRQRSTLLDHSLRSEGERRVADPQPRTRPARMSDGRAMNRPIVRLYGLVVAAVRAARRVHLALDDLRSLLAARKHAQRAHAARAAAHRPRPDPGRRRHGARAQRCASREGIYERSYPTGEAVRARGRLLLTPNLGSTGLERFRNERAQRRRRAPTCRRSSTSCRGASRAGEKVITTLDPARPAGRRRRRSAEHRGRSSRWNRAAAPSR